MVVRFAKIPCCCEIMSEVEDFMPTGKGCSSFGWLQYLANTRITRVPYDWMLHVSSICPAVAFHVVRNYFNNKILVHNSLLIVSTAT